MAVSHASTGYFNGSQVPVVIRDSANIRNKGVLVFFHARIRIKSVAAPAAKRRWLPSMSQGHAMGLEGIVSKPSRTGPAPKALG